MIRQWPDGWAGGDTPPQDGERLCTGETRSGMIPRAKASSCPNSRRPARGTVGGRSGRSASVVIARLEGSPRLWCARRRSARVELDDTKHLDTLAALPHLAVNRRALRSILKARLLQSGDVQEDIGRAVGR